MNLKLAILASLLVAFATTSTMGCGGDDCARGGDHLAECLDTSSISTDNPDEEAQCDGASLCLAKCSNEADCDAIKDAFSDAPGDKSKPFLQCTARCSMVK
jgi:hypothetical protein